jgi:hypothetical protein
MWFVVGLLKRALESVPGLADFYRLVKPIHSLTDVIDFEMAGIAVTESERKASLVRYGTAAVGVWIGIAAGPSPLPGYVIVNARAIWNSDLIIERTTDLIIERTAGLIIERASRLIIEGSADLVIERSTDHSATRNSRVRAVAAPPAGLIVRVRPV